MATAEDELVECVTLRERIDRLVLADRRREREAQEAKDIQRQMGERLAEIGHGVTHVDVDRVAR